MGSALLLKGTLSLESGRQVLYVLLGVPAKQSVSKQSKQGSRGAGRLPPSGKNLPERFEGAEAERPGLAGISTKIFVSRNFDNFPMRRQSKKCPLLATLRP
jgi:hypothetical protein